MVISYIRCARHSCSRMDQRNEAIRLQALREWVMSACPNERAECRLRDGGWPQVAMSPTSPQPYPDAKGHLGSGLLQGLGDGPSKSLTSIHNRDTASSSKDLSNHRGIRPAHLIVRHTSDEGLLACRVSIEPIAGSTYAQGVRNPDTDAPRRSTLSPSPTPAAWTLTLLDREVDL